MVTDSGVVGTDRPLRFRILGPLEVDVGPRAAELGGPRQRALLAHLLLRANRLVPADALLDSLWGDEQPETARGVIQTYVSLLRRAIGKERIEGRPPGYVLLVRPDELDATRFDRLLRDAKRTLPADPTHALVTIDDALRLWRGPALADVATQPGIAADAARLNDLRVDAEETRVLALLSSDQARLAIAEAERLLVDEPLREGVWGLLMVALYREGRQADALQAYARARRLLGDELGVDPSPELERLQQRVLRQDPDLEARGERLRGYQLLEKMRARPEAVIYRARQPRVGRDVAIAVFRDEIASDPEFARRFEPEVRAVAALDHPAISPIVDFWREPGSACVVSQYQPGGSLAGRLERGDILEPEQAAQIVERIRGAIAFAHQHDVAHGDLTPESVTFDADGRALLTAFRVTVGPPPNATADLDALAAIARRLNVALPDEGAPAGHAATESDQRASMRHVRNPYKGLRAFEEQDAPDFFGRQRAVRRLLARLSDPAPEGRSLFIVGPSGSGKSSVVRAGLMPELRAGALDDDGALFVTDMFPGTSPMEALEVALERVAVEGPDQWRRVLRSGPRGLVEACSILLPPGARVVLVVDQLEEAFTLSDDEAERELFLESLRVAVVDPDSRLRLVATLRADMFDRPLAYPRFGELLVRRSEVLMPLAPDEIEQAVRGPAEREGVTIEAGLVAALVADAVHQPGSLPLLQFCLSELFEGRTEDVVELRSYEAIGGVAGALSARAERVYLDFDGDGRRAMREILLRLVTLGEGRSDTRRRVARSELDSLDVSDEAIESVLEVLGRHRLLTFDREDSSREPTVEVAHEALLDGWSRLRSWIDDARNDLRTEQALARAAAEWRAADRDDSFLLTGPRLDQAEVWARSTGLALGRDERAFLRAGVERRTRERAEDDARVETGRRLERRAHTRLQALVGVLLIGVIVASSLGGIALWQSVRADNDARIAQARELVAAALAGIDEDPERSVLLAIEAVRATRASNGVALPEAEGALRRAIAASHSRLLVPDIGGALAWSPQGSFVAANGLEPGVVEIRAESDGALLRSFSAHDGPLTDVAFSSDGLLLGTTGKDGCLRVWESQAVTPIAETCGTGFASGVSIAAGRAAATWPDVGVTRVIDVTTGANVLELQMTSAEDTSLEPNGQRIAIVTDGQIEVYDVEGGGQVFDEPLREPADNGGSWPIGQVAWSPDGASIASASLASADVWSALNGHHVAAYGPPGAVEDVAWSTDSDRLATAGSDGRVGVWDAATSSTVVPIFSLTANALRSGADAIALSPDGGHVLATGRDGVAGWDITKASSDEVLSFPTIAINGDVAFTPDGEWIVAADAESGRIAWRSHKGGPPTRTVGPELLEHWFELSPDGRMIAVTTGGGPLTVWDTITNRQIFASSLADAEFDWSPDGTHLIAGDTILDLAGREVARLERDGFTASEPRFSADGKLASITGHGPDTPEGETGPSGIALWDVEARRSIAFIDAAAFDAVFDPTGTRLAIDGGGRDEPSVWDIAQARRLFTLAGAGTVLDMSFSPDGSLIATAGEDGAVRLFEADEGRQIGILWSTSPYPRTVTFSPDGRMLAAQRPGEVRVWAVDIDLLLEIASERVTRSLTDDECRQFLHTDHCPPPAQ